MCIVCNITQNEFIETALAVENVFDGEYMTIPITTTPVSYTHLTLPTNA